MGSCFVPLGTPEIGEVFHTRACSSLAHSVQTRRQLTNGATRSLFAGLLLRHQAVAPLHQLVVLVREIRVSLRDGHECGFILDFLDDAPLNCGFQVAGLR